MDAYGYIALFRKAFDNMPQSYYKVITTYNKDGIVRERAFCYELYHIVRCLQTDKEPLILNGEIDKRGHSVFKDKDRKNPDFVFHRQGSFAENELICEVKGIIRNDDGIVKDIKTLSNFVRRYNYSMGLFILYNHSVEELSRYLKTHAKALPGVKRDTIYVMAKRSQESELEEIGLEQLLDMIVQ